MFPIIPILALVGILVGTGTLVWYSELSREEKQKADGAALKWFGRRFEELSEHQQKQIRDRMNNSG